MDNWLDQLSASHRELREKLDTLHDELTGVITTAQAIKGLSDDAARAPSYHEAAYWTARDVLAVVYGYAPPGTPAAHWFARTDRYAIDWAGAADELRQRPRLDAERFQMLLAQESAEAIRRLGPLPTVAPVADAAPEVDGPLPGDRFRYNRTSHDVTPTTWKLINAMWGHDSRNSLDVEQDVWGDGLAGETTLKSALRDANKRLREICYTKRIAKVRRQNLLVWKQD